MCVEKSPWEQVLDFHGHLCLEITLGYRLAQIAQRELGIKASPDTELMIWAHTHSCALDAFQMINQVTFGRGNLHVVEEGKHIYEFRYSRSAETIILEVNPALLKELEEFRTYTHPREKQANLLKGVRYILDREEKDFCSIEHRADRDLDETVLELSM